MVNPGQMEMVRSAIIIASGVGVVNMATSIRMSVMGKSIQPMRRVVSVVEETGTNEEWH
jgi:hypothetical protein